MTGVQWEQNTLHLGAARWRPESWYSVGEVRSEKWGKWKVMLGWWSQPASFSSPAIQLNPLWSPHQSWWLLLVPGKKRWWHERGEGIEQGTERRVGVEDNGCLFISHTHTHTQLESSNQENGHGCYASRNILAFFRRQLLLCTIITVNQIRH